MLALPAIASVATSVAISVNLLTMYRGISTTRA